MEWELWLGLGLGLRVRLGLGLGLGWARARELDLREREERRLDGLAVAALVELECDVRLRDRVEEALALQAVRASRLGEDDDRLRRDGRASVKPRQQGRRVSCKGGLLGDGCVAKSWASGQVLDDWSGARCVARCAERQGEREMSVSGQVQDVTCPATVCWISLSTSRETGSCDTWSG